MPRIFIIACEPSADAHGAHLVSELKKRRPDFEFSGLGGPAMAAEGVGLLEDMTRISALGLGDVLRKYFVYRGIFYRALAEVEKMKPDAIVVLDSPAFNLRFAKKIRKRFPFIYYISPQIWAWGGRRIHTIKRTVSHMITILPFEEELYRKAGVPCTFVGHPLLDQIPARYDRPALRAKLGLNDSTRAVGLLAGSREKEVVRILPPMLESARLLGKMLPGVRFFVTPSPNVPLELYERILKDSGADAKITDMPARELVAAVDFALIASGTATLEAALIGTPFFLMYKASWSTYLLGRQLIRVKFLGLANLLAGKRVVPEFIQGDIHPQTIAHEAKVLLENPDLYAEMKREFAAVKDQLGQPGASGRAAETILRILASCHSEARGRRI